MRVIRRHITPLKMEAEKEVPITNTQEEEDGYDEDDQEGIFKLSPG